MKDLVIVNRGYAQKVVLLRRTSKGSEKKTYRGITGVVSLKTTVIKACLLFARGAPISVIFSKNVKKITNCGEKWYAGMQVCRYASKYPKCIFLHDHGCVLGDCTSAAVRACSSRGGAGYIGDWIAWLGIWRLSPSACLLARRLPALLLQVDTHHAQKLIKPRLHS